MSIKVMTKVWASSKAKGSQLLLLLAIADFADDEGKAFPSIKTLAEKTRLSTRQTTSNVQALEKLGELRVTRSNKVNQYKIVVKRLQYEKDAGLQVGSEVEFTSEVKSASIEPSFNHQDNRQKEKEGATAISSGHPAIKAFRNATHRYAAKSWWPILAETVGEETDNVERWAKVCMEWVGKGWNPMNIQGMLDVYQNGWQQKGGNGSSEPKGYQAIREYLQEKGMTGGN